MIEHMLHARALKAVAQWRDDEVRAKQARAASAEPTSDPPSPSSGDAGTPRRLTNRLRLALHGS